MNESLLFHKGDSPQLYNVQFSKINFILREIMRKCILLDTKFKQIKLFGIISIVFKNWLFIYMKTISVKNKSF